MKKKARQLPHLLASILLLTFFSFSLLGSKFDSPISDEPGHIAAGIAYFRQNNLVYNSGSPLLANILSSIPLNFYLNNNDIPHDSSFSQTGYLHSFARELMYQNKYHIDTFLLLARLPIIILGTGIGLLIYLWTSQLVGPTAALFPLSLYVFDTNFLAHSHYATTDVPLTFFFMLTLFLYWCYLKYRRRYLYLLTILSFVLAQLTKISAIYLVPLVWVLEIFYPSPANKKFKSLFILTAVLGLSTWLGINLLYGFSGLGKSLHYFLTHDPSFLNSPFSIDSVESLLPFKDSVLVQYLYKDFPLPISYHYLKVFGWVLFRSQLGQTAFLLNQFSDSGWWYYFPLTLFFKLHPITILGFLASLLFVFNKNNTHHRTYVGMFIVIAFYLLAASTSGINTGIRLVFPIIPFVFILSGISISKLKNKIPFLLPLLLLVLSYSTIAVFPHYLGYLNNAAGPSSRHHLVLADSNIDWGQDLKHLSRYLDTLPKDTSIKMNLFGVTTPETYGHDYPLYGPSWIREDNAEYSCEPIDNTLFIISTNQLIGLYLDNHDCFSWLQEKSPITTIGTSIFVYDL